MPAQQRVAGAAVCPCAGHHVDYTCRQCGRSGNPHGGGRCASCVLAERTHAPLAGLDGAVSAKLRPLLDAMSKVEAPFSEIRWISSSPNVRLLTRLAADDRPIRLELLDELPPSRTQQATSAAI